MLIEITIHDSVDLEKDHDPHQHREQHRQQRPGEDEQSRHADVGRLVPGRERRARFVGCGGRMGPAFCGVGEMSVSMRERLLQRGSLLRQARVVFEPGEEHRQPHAADAAEHREMPSMKRSSCPASAKARPARTPRPHARRMIPTASARRTRTFSLFSRESSSEKRQREMEHARGRSRRAPAARDAVQIPADLLAADCPTR